MRKIAILFLLMAGAPLPAEAEIVSGPGPSAPAQVKIFELTPEQASGAFMCNQGALMSLLVDAIPDGQTVAVDLVDGAKRDIPMNVWTSASGFRFIAKPLSLVRVTMICAG